MFLQKRCHVRPGDSACRERRRARSRWYFFVPKGVLDVLGVDGQNLGSKAGGRALGITCPWATKVGVSSNESLHGDTVHFSRPCKILQLAGAPSSRGRAINVVAAQGLMSSLTSSSRCSSVPSASVARSSSSSRLTRKFQPLSSRAECRT